MDELHNEKEYPIDELQEEIKSPVDNFLETGHLKDKIQMNRFMERLVDEHYQKLNTGNEKVFLLHF